MYRVCNGLSAKLKCDHIEEVEAAMEVMPEVTSLYWSIGTDDSSLRLGQFVEDECVSDSSDAVISEFEKARFEKAIEYLPKRVHYMLVRC